MQAKAFDRQTSVLHYLVSIVQKNDEDVLNLSEDFVPVKAAERVSMEMLAQQLKEVQIGLELVRNVAKRHLPESVVVPTNDTPDDEVLGATPMGTFALSAATTIESLSKDFTDVKSSFADLLQFFGEEATMSPEVFFCTINTFVSLFDQTHKELKRKEEAKVRVCRYYIMLLFVCVVHIEFYFICNERSGRKGSKRGKNYVSRKCQLKSRHTITLFCRPHAQPDLRC